MRTAAVVSAVNVASLALLGTASQQNHKLGKPNPAIRQKTNAFRVIRPADGIKAPSRTSTAHADAG
jgi:hypothetical protein